VPNSGRGLHESCFSCATTLLAADTLNVMKKSSKILAKSAKVTPPRSKVVDFDEATFAEISKLISASRDRALLSVNTVLIDLYWKVGEHISRKIAAAEWGRRRRIATCTIHRSDTARLARVYAR
jgi:hypothetical protein